MQIAKIFTLLFPTVDLKLAFCLLVEIVIKSKESFPGFVLGHFRVKRSCFRIPLPPIPRVARVLGGACVGSR